MRPYQKVINHIMWMHRYNSYPKWEYTDFWRLHLGYGNCTLKL